MAKAAGPQTVRPEQWGAASRDLWWGKEGYRWGLPLGMGLSWQTGCLACAELWVPFPAPVKASLVAHAVISVLGRWGGSGM